MSPLHEEAKRLAEILPELGERLMAFAQRLDEVSEALFRHDAVVRESRAPRAAPPPTNAVIQEVTNAASPAPAPVTRRGSELTRAKWPEARLDLLFSPAWKGHTPRELLEPLNALPGLTLTVRDVENRRYLGRPKVSAPAGAPAPKAAKKPAVPPVSDRIETMKEIVAKRAAAQVPGLNGAPAVVSGERIVADREQIRAFAMRKGWPAVQFDLDDINARCRRVGAPEFVLRAAR